MIAKVFSPWPSDTQVNISEFKMSHSNIARQSSISQQCQDDTVKMKGMSLTALVHNLIREYKTCEFNTYSVDVMHFTPGDKKLILSHLLDASEYQDACVTQSRLDAVFMEYLEVVEEAIESECYTVYCEDMEESGMRMIRHTNNDEVYWARY